MSKKYVFLTGGVVSGLGKGITAASLGRLLKARGYSVTLQKFDPYFNVDSSNLSPYQHGEIFVTGDGGESELVVGHYERMTDENLSRDNDVTSGQIYSAVIARERGGDYNGRTVQVVPHITDEIKSRIKTLEKKDVDIIIIEIGGTAGDIECHPFLEAIRQFKQEVGKDNVAFIHVTLVPFIPSSGEQKTKPTQRSVKQLQDVGIQPDIIVCRSEQPIDLSSKQKLALFCNVKENCIIQDLDTDEIYSIPLKLEDEGFASQVLSKLKLTDKEPDLSAWKTFCKKADKLKASDKSVKIAIVGKYVEKHDAYVSLQEALFYSSIEKNIRAEIVWVHSEEIDKNNIKAKLKDTCGIIIAAGFGERGFEGKIIAANYARENKVPCLMTGLGAEAGYIEYARNVLKLKDANSAEFEPDSDNKLVCKVTDDALEFKRGAHITRLKKGTNVQKIYGSDSISERHRHKYELNLDFADVLENAGLTISGRAESGVPECFEISAHPYYIGVIFHPEFTARPTKSSPLITAFLTAAVNN